LGVIVPVLVTAYGVRHITDPIQKLIQAAEQVMRASLSNELRLKRVMKSKPWPTSSI